MRFKFGAGGEGLKKILASKGVEKVDFVLDAWVDDREEGGLPHEAEIDSGMK